MKTKIIAFYNAKGGVGKTTSTVNVGVLLAQKNKKVLLIDTDPQGNLSKLCGLEDEDIEYSIIDVLKDGTDINETVIPVEFEQKRIFKNEKLIKFDIIVCNRAKIKQEEYLYIKSFINNETTLSQAIKNLRTKYDYILLDCPPALSEMTVNSLTAATHVVVPMKIDRFSFDGLGELSQKIIDIQNNYNSALSFVGVFVTMDINTNVNKQVKELLKENLGDKVFKTSIRQTSKVIESTFDAKPIVLYAPKSTAAQDYHSLMTELLKKVNSRERV